MRPWQRHPFSTPPLSKMQKFEQQSFSGERALFQTRGARISYCVFHDGESPLKESADLDIDSTLFRWKYPLWHCENVRVKDSVIFDTGRAGIWYTNNIEIRDTLIEAPKTFRRSKNISLENVNLPNAAETLWTCENIGFKNVQARGDYFAKDSKNIRVDGFSLTGNYAFDGGRDIEIHHAKMISKDAFWNAENVAVYDSFISGEYLGWNSKNLTFVNCVIESLQGLCRIENLTMKNCRLVNTTLAFEYSTVDADLRGTVDSVFNPAGGVIRADRIGTLTMDETQVDVTKTKIVENAQK